MVGSWLLQACPNDPMCPGEPVFRLQKQSSIIHLILSE